MQKINAVGEIKFGVEGVKLETPTSDTTSSVLSTRIVKAKNSDIDHEHQLSDLGNLTVELINLLKDQKQNVAAIKIEVNNGFGPAKFYTLKNKHVTLNSGSENVIKMTTVVEVEHVFNYGLDSNPKIEKGKLAKEAEVLAEGLRDSDNV